MTTQNTGFGPEHRMQVDVVHYRDLMKMAVRLIARETRSVDIEASDLVHDAWLRLRDQAWVDDDHRNALFSLTMKRVLLDYWRRNSTPGGAPKFWWAPPESVTAASNTENPLGDCVVRQAVRRACKHHAREVQVLLLNKVEGYTAEEIASTLDMSERTVKRYICRSRSVLQHHLTPRSTSLTARSSNHQKASDVSRGSGGGSPNSSGVAARE
jgi:DNA-directed RNA polymerase specialized sigma24 family protein